MSPFWRRRPTLDHPYFGRLTAMSEDLWEGELTVPGSPEKLGLVIPARETGPSERHVALCRALLDDLDGLFERCRPVFAADFEVWAGKALPSDWRTDFALVGLGLPSDGDETQPWDVCYFVDAANHYFTAHFEDGRASYLTVDG